LDPFGLTAEEPGLQEDWFVTLVIPIVAYLAAKYAIIAMVGAQIAGRLGIWGWKIAVHPAHHYFTWFGYNFGYRAHIQMIIWKVGLEGSHKIWYFFFP
jgi:hypothetical protein